MGYFEFSTDKLRLNSSEVQELLHPQCWKRGLPAETVFASLSESRCVAAFLNGRLVGFARLVTDEATFAYVRDVCVSPSCRHQGVARRMVELLLLGLEDSALRASLRATRSQRRLFRSLGFQPITAPLGFLQASEASEVQGEEGANLAAPA
jgi:N-acetylglutamate synthase-like GNAT family acetyltransferase